MSKEYSEDQKRTICETAQRSLLPNDKYGQLLYFAMYGRKKDTNRYNVFSKNINKYLFRRSDPNGDILPPEPFNEQSIRVKVEREINTGYKKYSIIFGIATIDGHKYLPKQIRLAGNSYSQVKWRTVKSYLKKHNQETAYLNTFIRTANLVDFIHPPEVQRVNFTSQNIYSKIEEYLSKNIYYKVSLSALDEEAASEIAENDFKKVLAAASVTYIMSSQNITWTRSGIMQRRAPAMFNGVFLVTDISKNRLSLLENDDKILQANQSLLKNTDKQLIPSILKNYSAILAKTKNSTNVIDEKITVASSILHDALSSRNIATRQLGLWQCLESGIGWDGRREKDIIKTLKNFYDPSNPNNAIWNIIGDYVLAKRGLYVHEATALSRDSHGTYDSSLNLYHDYINAMFVLLIFMSDNKNKLKIKSEEDFQNFMEHYKLNNQLLHEEANKINKDAHTVDWLLKNRNYGNKEKYGIR